MVAVVSPVSETDMEGGGYLSNYDVADHFETLPDINRLVSTGGELLKPLSRAKVKLPSQPDLLISIKILEVFSRL